MLFHFISFSALVLFTGLWFILKERKVSTSFVGKGFWFSLISYLISLVFGKWGLLFELLFLVPLDIAIFVILIILFNNFVSKSRLLFTIFGIILLIIKFFAFDMSLKMYQSMNATAKLDAKGELLMDLGDGKNIKELQALFDEYDISYRKAFTHLRHKEYSALDDYYVLDISDKHEKELKEIAQRLMTSGYADWVEQNEIVQTAPIDGDEIQKNTTDYGLNDPDLSNLWSFKAMQMDALYKALKDNGIKPAKVAKIAILDTGVDDEHEDINANFISTDESYNEDVVGHGTHCAGIANAVSNNAKGIASFSPANEFVKVTSIKVLNDWGGGTQESVIGGIIEAADKGADVISMSLGGPSDDGIQRAYNEAVKYANEAGAIVIVAAGNSDENAMEFSPANSEGVITVSAVEDGLKRAEFSNYVTDVKMGIAAPGVNIYSTFPKNEYKFLSGTSMATPYVAGLVGLMKSINPNLDSKTAYQILKETGIPTQDTEKTGNFIQPAKAVERSLQVK
ncbi:MAG: S8 family serine peptidase [Thermoflexibacter sp.]|nr:S8 family serine peptidase [Thermoflexibacter sp.]